MSDEPTTNFTASFVIPDEDPSFKHIPSKYYCSGCKKLLRHAFQTVCGHHVCETCKDELKECPVGDNDCKLSASLLEESESFIERFDTGIKRELSRLTVFCPFRHRGCAQECQWRHLQIHSENCEYGIFPCPYVKYGCEFKEIPRNKIIEHANKCKFHPERKVECRFGCGLEVKVKDLESHETECKNVHINCPLEDLGCTKISDVASREKVEEHIRSQNAFHFGLVSDSFGEVNDCVEVLTKDLIAVSETVEKLKDEIKKKDEIILRLQEEIANNRQDARNSNNNPDSFNSQEKSNSSGSFHSLEVNFGLLRVKFDEMEVRLESLEKSSYNGVLMWKIVDYMQKKRDAKTKKASTIYSPPFYSTRFGYKMCARAYLNGDGAGKDTHFSLYFVIMKGDFDHLLKWPFQQKITLSLLDMSGNGVHVSDTFRPDPNSKSFKKPTSDLNVASGCPQFIPIDLLENPSNGYLKDNQLLIKVSIDTSGLKDP
ncbi:DgyrCDS1739 [Dimorphilus gyrociliatus]|uniref:DgyrCDS1739 n=1 Tax=Dimorphilus gyrociliatus TaxID=2664684 RepID=A0A7I8V850_9ANNE|nr:DgyrCDS1739 [Dimorphilus gyrociliatus]